MNVKTGILIVAVFVLAIIVRFFKLDQLPGEWYGDISIVHDYVQAVLHLTWPFYFITSAGPVYHYLIAPIIAILGDYYYGYKVASVCISFIGILAIYSLTTTLQERKTGLIAAVLLTVSSWYLIFSRLGNSQILIPVIVSLFLLCLALYERKKQFLFLIFALIFSATGFYIYPQTYVLPPFGLFSVIVLSMKNKTFTVKRGFIISVLFFILTIPFIILLMDQPDNFSSGYVGSKFFGSKSLSLTDSCLLFLSNLLKTAGMLFYQGDITFRSNPSLVPHIDLGSFIFLISGIVVGFRKNKNRFFHMGMLVLFTVLIIPASWIHILQIEIPSASRTIAVLPLLMYWIACGVSWFFQVAQSRINSIFAAFFVSGLIGILIFINMYRYFVLYSYGLPNHNAPIGRIIAEHIDAVPTNTKAYVVGCCWGEWRQPEPDGIRFAKKKLRGIDFIDELTVGCNTLQSGHEVYFFAPNSTAIEMQLQACYPDGVIKTFYSSYQQPLYSIFSH